MKVLRELPKRNCNKPCALTIGNFDGFHIGHDALIKRLCEIGNHKKIQKTLLTFEPHPKEFFAKKYDNLNLAPLRISTFRDKLKFLVSTEIDIIIIKKFNSDFANLSAENFIKKILIEKFQIKFLIIGDDFRFGFKREGNFQTLVNAGKKLGFEVESIPTVSINGKRISSSEIRSLLKNNKFEEAKKFLGYPYSISGHVLHGKKIGQKIGFPTLNIKISHSRPIISGIFVVLIHGLSDFPLNGVASLGVRPTIEDDNQVLLETHVFNFTDQCYGKLVSVEILKKIRDEKKYNGLEELTKAIKNDTLTAKDFFISFNN